MTTVHTSRTPPRLWSATDQAQTRQTTLFGSIPSGRHDRSLGRTEYLEIFHNRQRRHSSIGMLSPIEYEHRYADNLARDQAS